MGSGIDYVSLLAPFQHKCSCFGVVVFDIIINCIVYIFLAILRPKIDPLNLPRGSWGLRLPPKNRVSTPPSFQGFLFIDSASLLNRFGDDFEGLSAECSVVFCNILNRISVQLRDGGTAACRMLAALKI